MEIRCSHCGKTFGSKYSRYDHVRRYHSSISLQCHHCKYSTTLRPNLIRHMKVHFPLAKQQHHAKQKRSKPEYRCLMCPNDALLFDDRQSVLAHYVEAHEVSIEKKKFECKSFDEFLAWKSSLEKREKCSFIASSGSYRTPNKIIRRFRCFRDGSYCSKGKGKRRLKVKGSCKIGGICPAGITLSEDRHTGITKVTYVGTHVGHVADIGKLNLSDEEKGKIARKIAAKVPFDAILDSIRDSVVKGEVERADLVTRKDLWNIEQAFNLNKDTVSHQNDCISVDSWVKSCEKGSSIVRFYKPQNIASSSHPYLLEDDFILIIALDTQLEILQKFGPHCVCFDSTHGFNQYGFDLTTILVLNGDHQGFPSAFMVSNRTDHQIISLFVETLKLYVGEITTNVLMSDMAENFFNGWCAVMPPPKHRLFCSWHVDHAWRKNLNKIPDVDKRADVYKIMKTLQTETEENTFLPLLESALRYFSEDQDTEKFGDYFKSEYEKSVTSWAYCFRKDTGINTNMALESMHKVLKHIYLHGKKVKRLDKALHALVRFTRDKLFDLVIANFRGKVTPKLTAIRKRHQLACGMDDIIITEIDSGWSIRSSQKDSFQFYEVRREVTDECDCGLKCDECGICVHSFSCTCIDRTIKFNICKHIHKVNMSLKNKSPEPTPFGSAALKLVENENGSLQISESQNNLPTSIFNDLGNLQPATHDFNAEKAQEELKVEFSKVVKGVTSSSHVDVLRKLLRSVQPTFEAMDAGLSFKSPRSPKKVNPCANVSPQKFFRSTKKSRKPCSAALKKPTSAECNNIALNLLLAHDENQPPRMVGEYYQEVPEEDVIIDIVTEPSDILECNL